VEESSRQRMECSRDKISMWISVFVGYMLDDEWSSQHGAVISYFDMCKDVWINIGEREVINGQTE
jgi:hypothetical protein